MLIVEGHTIQNYRERMTDDELLDFCSSNRNLQIERDKHQNIIIMSPSGGLTGRNELTFGSALANWAYETKNGIPFGATTGFLLPNGAMRAPDAAWLSTEKWNSLTRAQKEKFINVVPEFIAEIKSPSDHLNTLQQKMEEWMESGVLLGWLIDPQAQQVFIYRLNNEPELIEGFDKTLSGNPTLPGFEFSLSALLAS